MSEPFEINGEKTSEHIHGYNLKSGAWALYPDKDGSSTPATFITIRPYRKRREIVVNQKRILRITP
jgi:hypothetical protein